MVGVINHNIPRIESHCLFVCSFQNHVSIVTALSMDPLFEAMSLFRRRKYDASAVICTKQLEKNPLDQVSTMYGAKVAVTDVAFG